MNDKDIKMLTLEGNESSASGCMVVSAGMECKQDDIDMPHLDCKKMRTASPILVRGEKHDEGEEQELEEGEIPTEQGSDYGSVRPSEGSHITDSSTGQGGLSHPKPLFHEVGPNSTNQGKLENCQETDLKILCSVVTPSPAESSNNVTGACGHCQERRKIELTQERGDENEVQTGKGHLKHAAPRGAGELPGNVVRRNFDLNLLPDMDEDQDFTSTKDDRQGDVSETSTTNTTATKHLLQTPNKVTAFSPYASSSRKRTPGVQNPAHLNSQSSRSHHPVMAPPHTVTKAPEAPRARRPQPPGVVLSMNARPTVFRSMVAAVSLPPGNNHGRKRIIAAASAAAGPPTNGPPFMVRARAPNMVQPPAHLLLHYGIQPPRIMQRQQQQAKPAVRQQRQQTLQLFPKSS